ncbi:hypothetical protein (DUF2393 domain) [Campylobacter subantarcticus LMG 24377]|uniref:DUF2393 domain protein n=2 Tax=Campylobacter subantarcticus TaxID=497724 RepID=A0A0A8HES5_9BACT|nr:DUF2393 domain-containing membrane protein [Campylobacter subantarcticus]EAJ1260992.1 DUF2393 domain-containing membrane protein [Campylobacter lari]AJC91414.1 hypothetical protein (DUF2393 domain) [Campylobacter subantarcticus LMG 24374]AJC93181.1 hypothetical protein (DUF2393 domain) [Campylobacter subantarcticus LMG 24377]EAJ1262096.1 DUF2393 domain-containing membrane protein [Campylobacter lari]EAL3938751.1 DUF2393 domain-containing membrane protein [Campylobacter lari]
MNAQHIREQMIFYTTHLHLIDFLLMALVIFFFIITLFIALIIRNKPVFAFIVIFLGILCSASIAYLGYFLIDTKVRSRIASLDNAQFFVYDNSLSIDYSLTNTSKKSFRYCKLKVEVFKKSDGNSTFKNLIHTIKPLRSRSTMIEKIINPQQTINLKTKFSDFKEGQNFDIEISSKCF